MSELNLLEVVMANLKQSKKKTDKQQKIVETAIKLFAEKGYANTSTSEIAKGAGVAEGTIFRHYQTKDHLLLSIIVPFIKESLPTLADHVIKEVMDEEVVHFEQFLRRLLKNRINFINNNQEIFQILIKEMIYNEELRKELSMYFYENVFSRVNQVLTHFKERDELIDLPSKTIVNFILTFFGGYLVSRFVFQSEPTIENEEEELNTIVRFIMDGIGKA